MPDEIELPPHGLRNWHDYETTEQKNALLVKVREDQLRAALRQVDEKNRENEKLQAKLTRIHDWTEAYPLEQFPAPDWAEVKRLLGESLLSRVSAANMRHVVEGIKKISKED